MELSGSQVYPVPVDAAMALFADRDATVAKYTGMGHRDVAMLDVTRTDDELRVVSTRVVDVDLPGFAKKALKPTNTMVQTDQWRRGDGDAWAGTFDVEVKGSPVRIAGRMTLVPDGGGCRHDVTIDLTVKIPLIGGKIADWAAKNDVRRTLDAEFAFNLARLGG